MGKIIMFHHSADNDGKASGAIVKSMFPDCMLIPINYGDTFPWGEIASDDVIYMSDFCLEPIERMVHLAKKCKQLIWIDHHISSINEAHRVNFNPDGIREVGKSGCELTWEYIYPGKEMPTSIRIMGRYDVWDHTDARSFPFQYGSAIENMMSDNAEIWSKLIDDDQETIDRIVNNGIVIYKYQMLQYAAYAKSHAFEGIFDGLRCIAVNLGKCSSLAFESVYDPERHDIMLSFAYSANKTTMSIYSDKPAVDVSQVALKFGGGGHAGAAGFELKELAPLLKPVDKEFLDGSEDKWNAKLRQRQLGT